MNGIQPFDSPVMGGEGKLTRWNKNITYNVRIFLKNIEIFLSFRQYVMHMAGFLA